MASSDFMKFHYVLCGQPAERWYGPQVFELGIASYTFESRWWSLKGKPRFDSLVESYQKTRSCYSQLPCLTFSTKGISVKIGR